MPFGCLLKNPFELGLECAKKSAVFFFLDVCSCSHPPLQLFFLCSFITTWFVPCPFLPFLSAHSQTVLLFCPNFHPPPLHGQGSGGSLHGRWALMALQWAALQAPDCSTSSESKGLGYTNNSLGMCSDCSPSLPCGLPFLHQDYLSQESPSAVSLV